MIQNGVNAELRREKKTYEHPVDSAEEVGTWQQLGTDSQRIKRVKKEPGFSWGGEILTISSVALIFSGSGKS